MAGLGIADLPLPPRQFRPDLVLNRARQSSMETRQEARAEDALRLRRLRNHHTDDVGARNRLDSLISELSSSRPTSIASALYMRRKRVRFAGNLWQAVEAHRGNRSSLFTVIPVGWCFTSAELQFVNPNRLKDAFRADLKRAGVSDASGFLAACLHGEHDAASNSYQLHLHGIAVGDMIEVLDRLRTQAKYASHRVGFARQPGHTSQRLRMSRGEVLNLPYRLTYILQSWWPSRWTGRIAGSTDRVRSSARRRIPEPAHCEYLLWLHRWALSDLTLLIKLRVTRSGFSSSSPSINGAQS